MGVFARIRIWRRAPRDTRERGQALIETALVFTMLSTMLIGVADLAQVAYVCIEVANAAKAGAQYGCQNSFAAQDTTGIQTAASDEAPGISVAASSSTNCVCSDGTASTCANSDCPNSHIEQSLTVNTSATVTPLIHLPLLPSTYTVKGESIQRLEQ